MGILVTAYVTLKSLRGRRLWFQATVRDEDGLVAEGLFSRLDPEYLLEGREGDGKAVEPAAMQALTVCFREASSA